MIALTCKEILDGLKNLGINNISERKTCFREYVAYFVLQYLHVDSIREEVTREHMNQLQKILDQA